ncbi:hypothetical protein SPFM20_00078 [Salmonella phage SPFM20]|nr:hypothetical protein SPFM20_00078 [Salmonella phage SPFM20]
MEIFIHLQKRLQHTEGEDLEGGIAIPPLGMANGWLFRYKSQIYYVTSGIDALARLIGEVYCYPEEGVILLPTKTHERFPSLYNDYRQKCRKEQIVKVVTVNCVGAMGRGIALACRLELIDEAVISHDLFNAPERFSWNRCFSLRLFHNGVWQ